MSRPFSALRSPLTLSGPFASSFSLAHSTLNGDLSVPSSYVSLHLSPQVSSSVAYGRSPLVSPRGTDDQDGQQSGEGWAEEKPTVSKETRMSLRGWSCVVGCSPGTKAWCQPSATRSGRVGPLCHHSTWETEAGRSGARGQPVPPRPLLQKRMGKEEALPSRRVGR